MNCAILCAPARLTTSGLKPLSCKRRRMKNGIGTSFDCADVISVSQISRSERATTLFAVFGRAAESFGTVRSGVLLPVDGTSRLSLLPPGRRPCRTSQTDKRERKQASDACRPQKMRTHAPTRTVASNIMKTEYPSRRGAACIRIETEFGNACEENKNDCLAFSQPPREDK